MTRLIRWGHLANTRHVTALWYDDAAGRTQRTIVAIDYDEGRLLLRHVSGEPLEWAITLELGDEIPRAEDSTGYAPRPQFYTGVVEPATSALVG